MDHADPPPEPRQGGADLLAAGVPEGPAVGAALRGTLERKLDGGLRGGREAELELALALARAGRASDLARLRAAVGTQLGALPAFAFEEYLHGVTGAPGGTPHMAYTATGLVFLAHADSPRAARLFAAGG